MPREDHGPYTEYVSTYALNVDLPQFRGMYFQVDGQTSFWDTKGNVETLANHRAGDYVPVCGIRIIFTYSPAPILLY